MGGGSFDSKAYTTYTNSVASKPRAAVYASRGLHKDLDPKGVIRESRDSVDNPSSTPIIIGLDVTGSMGMIAEQIAKGGLGTLFEGILDRKPVSDPHLMFMGIGDAACDQVPLQVSQFEADNRIVQQLTQLFLEGGGGGNNTESYDLPWYFAAHQTVHDSMQKRGKRGYLFTVGDEMPPTSISSDALRHHLGSSVTEAASAKLSLEAAMRLYDVFHVVIEEGNYAARNPGAVTSAWREVLGQRVISLKDYKLLPETIVSAIQVAEGTDHTKAVSGWGSAAGRIIGEAVANLPRGVAPRMLGR